MKKLPAVAFSALFLLIATQMLGQTPVTEKLASGTFVVYAPSPQVWRVNVDPSKMNNVTISGHFVVTDGRPKAISVLVFNEANYTKWKDDDVTVRSGAKPVEAVMTAPEGNINAKLTEAGFHYLVISDRHEYEGKKTVNADIKLQYDKR